MATNPQAGEYGVGWGASYVFDRDPQGAWKEVAKLVDAPKEHRPPGPETWGDWVDFEGDTVVTSGLSIHDADDVMKGAANIHKVPLGTPYCTAEPHSSGWTAIGYAIGSRSVAENHFELWASRLPPHVWGYFLVSVRQPTQERVGSMGSGTDPSLSRPDGDRALPAAARPWPRV